MNTRLLAVGLFIGMSGAAFAQTGSNVGSGVGSNAGTMSGANIDVANGTNANGTPRQQSPGSSMTVGAGNSTMLPGITGNNSTGAAVPPPTVTGITKGTTTQTKPAQ